MFCKNYPISSEYCSHLERLEYPGKDDCFSIGEEWLRLISSRTNRFLKNLVRRDRNIETGCWQYPFVPLAPFCYEVDMAFRGQTHMMTILGPNIPLIAEYRQALEIYPDIKISGTDTFTLSNATAAVRHGEEYLLKTGMI